MVLLASSLLLFSLKITCYNFAVSFIDAAFEQKSGVLKNDIDPYK